MNYKDRKEGYPAGFFKAAAQQITKDKKNAPAFFQLDMMTSKSFAKNYGNHPRSDIALINEQQNLQAAQNLLNRLQVLPDDKRVGVSESALVANMRSKYCQTQGEMIRHFENLLEVRDKRLAREAFAREQAALAAQQAQQEKEKDNSKTE